MASPTKLLTYEEWLALPKYEDGIEEVVHGEIVRMRPNKTEHAYVVERLSELLKAQLLDPGFES